MPHTPVLKNEILETFGYLRKIKMPVFVDGTLGAGGHALAIALTQNLKLKTKNYGSFIGIDKDHAALEIAKENIAEAGLLDQFQFIHDDFKNIKEIFRKLKIEKIDGVLLDLGVSSMQFDQKERGFSFSDPDQPLDMRMDRRSRLTASDIINRYSESALAQIIFNYGEERWGKAIARAITRSRKTRRVSTVGDLLNIIAETLPPKVKYADGKHFATRTFQALRIEVNQELIGLDKAIAGFVEVLNPGGRLAVISFHSLEDRIVKQTFLKLADPCTCPAEMPCLCGKKPIVKIISKKPIVPSDSETRDNIRSRSAKLRIVEKI